MQLLRGEYLKRPIFLNQAYGESSDTISNFTLTNFNWSKKFQMVIKLLDWNRHSHFIKSLKLDAFANILWSDEAIFRLDGVVNRHRGLTALFWALKDLVQFRRVCTSCVDDFFQRLQTDSVFLRRNSQQWNLPGNVANACGASTSINGEVIGSHFSTRWRSSPLF